MPPSIAVRLVMFVMIGVLVGGCTHISDVPQTGTILVAGQPTTVSYRMHVKDGIIMPGRVTKIELVTVTPSTSKDDGSVTPPTRKSLIDLRRKRWVVNEASMSIMDLATLISREHGNGSVWMISIDPLEFAWSTSTVMDLPAGAGDQLACVRATCELRDAKLVVPGLDGGPLYRCGGIVRIVKSDHGGYDLLREDVGEDATISDVMDRVLN